MVWPDRDSKKRSSTFVASTLAITSPMRFRVFEYKGYLSTIFLFDFGTVPTVTDSDYPFWYLLTLLWCFWLSFDYYNHSILKGSSLLIKKSLKIQRGNQNPYIEEQTKQWPKENKQRGKQRSTKHTYKTKENIGIS